MSNINAIVAKYRGHMAAWQQKRTPVGVLTDTVHEQGSHATYPWAPAFHLLPGTVLLHRSRMGFGPQLNLDGPLGSGFLAAGLAWGCFTSWYFVEATMVPRRL